MSSTLPGRFVLQRALLHTYCVSLLITDSQHILSKVPLALNLSPAQCRAARALVNWSQDQLESAAKVARKTIADFEREVRKPYPRTLEALQAALEAAGVEFTNGDAPGVKLRARTS